MGSACTSSICACTSKEVRMLVGSRKISTSLQVTMIRLIIMILIIFPLLAQLTVIVKAYWERNTPCSEEKTYQATTGNLPSAFIDG